MAPLSVSMHLVPPFQMTGRLSQFTVNPSGFLRGVSLYMPQLVVKSSSGSDHSLRHSKVARFEHSTSLKMLG